MTSSLFKNEKPKFPDGFRLYGSSYIYIDDRIKVTLPIIWRLPHDLRRALFRKFFPKEYWRVLSARQDLEKSFHHDEHKHLKYSIQGFHKNKCIYIHIPKCGGISISQSMFGHCVPHSTITDYQLIFGSNIFNRYFKFTITRNPWDRIVSAYSFLKHGGFDKTDKLLFTSIVENLSFTEFVELTYHERNHKKWIHLFPQSYWIRTPSGKIPLDYIGRLETLTKSLEVISSELGIEIPPPQKTNASPRKVNYREYYTKKTREMVAELYREDIKLLGYRFEE